MLLLESVKVEPRLTSLLMSTLDILALFYLRELTCVAKNASVKINPQSIVRVYCILYAKDRGLKFTEAYILTFKFVGCTTLFLFSLGEKGKATRPTT